MVWYTKCGTALGTAFLSVPCHLSPASYPHAMHRRRAAQCRCAVGFATRVAKRPPVFRPTRPTQSVFAMSFLRQARQLWREWREVRQLERTAQQSQLESIRARTAKAESTLETVQKKLSGSAQATSP